MVIFVLTTCLMSLVVANCKVRVTNIIMFFLSLMKQNDVKMALAVSHRFFVVLDEI